MHSYKRVPSLCKGELESVVQARNLRPRMRACVAKRKSLCSELDAVRLRVKKLHILSSGDGEDARTHALALAEAVQRKNDLEDQREAVNAEMAGLQVTLVPNMFTPMNVHLNHYAFASPCASSPD